MRGGTQTPTTPLRLPDPHGLNNTRLCEIFYAAACFAANPATAHNQDPGGKASFGGTPAATGHRQCEMELLRDSSCATNVCQHCQSPNKCSESATTDLRKCIQLSIPAVPVWVLERVTFGLRAALLFGKLAASSAELKSHQAIIMPVTCLAAGGCPFARAHSPPAHA